MRKMLVSVGLVVAVMILTIGAPVMAKPTIIDLGKLGGDISVAEAINNRGQIVGASYGSEFGESAFLWENGTMTALGTNEAFAINERGQIVGRTGTATGTHAYLWQNGTVTDLGVIGGEYSSAQAINNRGEIAGITTIDDGGTSRTFVWRHGEMIPIDDLGDGSGINNRGQIVTSGGYLWWKGTTTYLGDFGGYTTAAAINDEGQVVGGSFTALGERHAFLWQNGTLTDLGTLGGPNSFATGINNRGQIVGVSNTADGFEHAFLWQNGVMSDLGTMVGPNAYSAAFGINDRGQIVGASDTVSGESHAALWRR